MCGIFVRTLGTDVSIDHCVLLLSKLKHRGPEATRYVVDGNVFVGFNRLPIISVSGGDQPFVSGPNILVANAEVFNHKTIELQTLTAPSIPTPIKRATSDCECILRAYEQGMTAKAIASLINGDFAFVLVTKDTIIAARDRVGIRPLFYGFKGSELIIASEVKAFPAGFSVEHVMPSTVMTFNRHAYLNDYIVERYYDLFHTYHITQAQNSLIHSPSTSLKTLLTQSLRMRLESERPVGCLLSGGLDSSVVALILTQILGAKNVRTYSIGMEGSLDLSYARKVADFLHTNHHEIVFTASEGINAIPEVVNALESYDITTVRASVPMYLLGKWIKEHTDSKVIFSGELSDELLCGYLYFHHAPSDYDAQAESLRLLKNVYRYDALRADRCISSHGLELRVPFADVNVLNYCMFKLTGKDKRPNGSIEKKILREAFSGELPDEVLWRRKDGFSDGVSSLERPWYTHIAEYVETLDATRFPPSVSPEAGYYKYLYMNTYGTVNYTPISEHWMPRWGVVDASNPSGRIIRV